MISLWLWILADPSIRACSISWSLKPHTKVSKFQSRVFFRTECCHPRRQPRFGGEPLSFRRKKHGLKLSLLSDVQHETLEKYGVWRPKRMYGREFMGVVRSTFLVDPEGRIAHIWSRVKVPGHVEVVKEKLAELERR